MQKLKNLDVLYKGRKVGSMALYKGRLLAFEYDKEWLADGFAVSPYSLPLRQQVFIPKAEPLNGVFGVFADSLPDGWGRFLADRMLLKNNIDPATVSSLERLAIVGNSGMGALTYEPVWTLPASESWLDLDMLALECSKIMQTEYADNLDELFRLGGSSGGARPKILTVVDGEDWIIKFPSAYDGKNIGRQEYDYSLCAQECGIVMEQTRLFPSKICEGYFGTRRFDRIRRDNQIERIHMLTVGGMLETSHRIPNLDYELLMKLVLNLTRDFTEVEHLYRIMCFNVFAHNRDDHAKNFSFLYNEQESRWQLAPAYDLTYSSSLGGEHATTVHGNGADPGIEELLAVAKTAGMEREKAKRIAENIAACVQERLKKYLQRKPEVKYF